MVLPWPRDNLLIWIISYRPSQRPKSRIALYLFLRRVFAHLAQVRGPLSRRTSRGLKESAWRRSGSCPVQIAIVSSKCGKWMTLFQSDFELAAVRRACACPFSLHFSPLERHPERTNRPQTDSRMADYDDDDELFKDL
jgi:hypothetical protein